MNARLMANVLRAERIQLRPSTPVEVPLWLVSLIAGALCVAAFALGRWSAPWLLQVLSP